MADDPQKPVPKFNWGRRLTGSVICLGPLALLLVSLAAAQVWPRQSPRAIGLAVVGLLVAGLNLYLTMRPAVYGWRHGSMEGFRNVSILPLLGTLFAAGSGVVGFGDWRAAALGILVLALDTGGLPWVLIVTWRDQDVWDA